MAIRQILMLELSDIVGPENVEDMTNYILSFQDVNDIKASLKDIIGNETVANNIATEILKSRGQLNVENERTTALKPKNQNDEDDYCIKDKPKTQKKPVSTIQMMELADEPEEQSQLPKEESKKSNTNMKYSRAIKSDVIPKPKCHCLGTIHPVLFNCSECGNIICKEEELEVCTYCGAFSRSYRQRRQGSPEEEESLRKAIESKNRLLQYDRDNTARSQVYDDQQDYFDLNDRWSGKQAAPDAYKPVYEQRSKQPIQISFDFAGRRVVVDERRVMNTKKQIPQEVKQEPRAVNTSGYYLEPTKDTPAQSIQKSQSADMSHVYKNDTLNGKANVVYESLTKKLQHGINLKNIRIKDDMKSKHMTKNWKKANDYNLILCVCITNKST